MIQVFFWFLLLFLPFIVNPFGGAFFEPPKVILAEVVIEMLTVYILLRHKLKLKKTFLYPISIIFVISLLNLLIFPSQTAFLGNQFRLQGTFLLWHLLLWSFISSQVEPKLPKFLPYLALTSLFFATFLLGTDNHRALGTLGEPNALAAVAIFFWPLSFFALFSLKHQPKLKRLLQSLSLLLALIIIYLSGSRSGLVALIVQILFLIIYNFSKNLKFALILGIILFLASFSLPSFITTPGFKFEDRSEVWRVALFAGLQKPILGQGFGNIENQFRPAAQKLNSDLQYQYVDSAHNIFLDYFMESGLIGFGVLVFLVISSLKNFLIQEKPQEIMLLLGLLIVLSFNPASIVTLIAFWWLIGQSNIAHS